MYLFGLGITALQLSQPPTADAFPRRFNPLAKSVWDSVCLLDLGDDEPEELWHSAIGIYLDQCGAKGIYPFQNTAQSANDRLYMQLVNARKAVTKFINQSKVFKIATLKAVKREVLMTQTGFVLRTYGAVQSMDPTLGQWLMKRPWPAFRIKSHGQYRKQLSNDVTMVLYNEGANGSQRWHIGYEIVCNVFPDMPSNTPSKAEMETFILKHIWNPILTANRPYQYHKRLL